MNDAVPYMDQSLICFDVEIKDGCWIGEKVCIMPGVTIEKNVLSELGALIQRVY